MGIYGRSRRWYQEQTPEFRRYLDAFAQGINAYAEAHGDTLAERSRRVLPVDAIDVIAHTQRVIHFSFVGRPYAVDQARQLVASPGQQRVGDRTVPDREQHAMLLINPHLMWSGQQLFYETHLTGPGTDFYGAALVGFPVMSLGFNRDLGWTHTVNTLDGADLYALTLEGDGYRFDGKVRAFESEEQTVLVRQDDKTTASEPLTIRRSVHGPVLAQGGDKAVAFRVVGLDAPGMLQEWWDMSRATDLRTFETALRRLQVPMFNVLYADRDGHILYVFNGRVPKRPSGTYVDWLGAVPGDTSANLWTDVLGYGDLPRVQDPPTGWLQNANEPPWTATVPSPLDPARFPSYLAPQFTLIRAQQSASLLAADDSISFTELLAYKHSTRMLLADRLLDDLIAAAREYGDTAAKSAAKVLAGWNRQADADAQGAVLFERWADRMNIQRSVVTLTDESRRLANETFTTPWDPSLPLTTPAGLKAKEKAAQALSAVASEVLEEYGTLSVTWGTVHRIVSDGLDLPVNGGPGDPLGVFRTQWFAPVENGKARIEGGDAFYAVVEFSQPLRARVMLAYGNSSQGESPHRGDQLAGCSPATRCECRGCRGPTSRHTSSRENGRE